jgi:hypothetical protein
MLKLFDAGVLLILLFGSEILGFERMEILERVHTKFCKLITKCSKFTHDTTIYGELGRLPFHIHARMIMINCRQGLLSGKIITLHLYCTRMGVS